MGQAARGLALVVPVDQAQDQAAPVRDLVDQAQDQAAPAVRAQDARPISSEGGRG